MDYRTPDPLFNTPFIDVDEWRDAPTRHRYVHGGFTDTVARFSFYFPPVEQYAGRFLQPVLFIAGTEHAATMGMFDGMGGSLVFAFSNGAYLVESNQGSTLPSSAVDATETYRTSAASARVARVLAAEMYGTDRRPYGYVFGGSGGAFKSMACIESTPDVWDGAVPFVAGSPMSIPNVFAVQSHAMRILWDAFPQIIDAVEPGGSGDMYAGLSAEQREALAEVTRFGFPPGAWFDVHRINASYTMLWTFFAETIRSSDPTYFSDFWTKPGYLGADPPASLLKARIDLTTTVAAVIHEGAPEAAGLPISTTRRVSEELAALPLALRVPEPLATTFRGAKVSMLSGAAVGRTLYISDVIGDIVMIGYGGDPAGLADVAAGDELRIDNLDYLAFQTYHRHQFAPGFAAWEQYVVAGDLMYPQRSVLVGPTMARGGAGMMQTGRFAGKVILVESMLDEAAYPWQADWYRQQVASVLGDRIDEQFRLWFVDHAMHEAPAPTVVPGDLPRPSRLSRIVSYRGVLEQAILDVIAWVELGQAPPSSTAYEVVDAQVKLPAGANERGGIQPVATLTVNKRERTNAAVGEAVLFNVTAEVPHGAGYFVNVEWDFEGDGTFSTVASGINGSARQVNVATEFAYGDPGIYFPAVRVTSHRSGNPANPHGRVMNLARARIIVE